MSTWDTIIRAHMAVAILALAAALAVTVNVSTGVPIVGAILFPVGFCILYLLGFDLVTGVFVLCPRALIDKRPDVTVGGVLRDWGLVFVGNFDGALTVAAKFTIMDYLIWNEIPTVLGNPVGGLSFTGLTLYATHIKTALKRGIA